MMLMRLQRALARAGVTSRRKAEDLIRAGRVRVDGAVATIGMSVDPLRQRVTVDGRAVRAAGPVTWLALNKPVGYVVSRGDPEGRQTVYGLLPHVPGLTYVGRLDVMTSGLLLFTTDGAAAHRLMHPRFAVPRTYWLRVHGHDAAEVRVALFEDEVRATARALEPYRGRATLEVEWGNVFLPAEIARLERGSVMANAEHRRLLLRDLLNELTDDVLQRSFLYQLLLKYKPEAVVDAINTATAFAYQDPVESAQELLALATAGKVDRAAVERHILLLTLPQLIRHVQILVEALRRAETRAYVKIGTSGTGGMGFNIPYTHSEERPSRPLLMKSAVAGAQSLLLFLLGRTPGAPATIEIKPTATIAWREIGFGSIRRKGKPIPLVDCPEPVPVSEAFRPGARPWCDLGKPLQGVYIDVGEDGLFSSDEFETVTALGQMEFITPQEVAEYAVLELEGRPTGRDVVTALDGATAGPTYRAGLLRAHALDRLRTLERQFKTRTVAYEMLGPPRLTKLLFESYICGQLRPSVRALAESQAGDLAP